jgi:hypothetical protein
VLWRQGVVLHDAAFAWTFPAIGEEVLNTKTGTCHLTCSKLGLNEPCLLFLHDWSARRVPGLQLWLGFPTFSQPL